MSNLPADTGLSVYVARHPDVACALPFSVVSDCSGLLGLGAKLVGEPYSDDDKELLTTLVNNLVVALRNARSFEEIKRLNLDLQEKNEQLEKALKELREALESLKRDQNSGAQQQEQQQSNQQEQEGVSPEEEPQDQREQQGERTAEVQLMEDAHDILDEEKENRERRQMQAAGAYRDVDKDW